MKNTIFKILIVFCITASSWSFAVEEFYPFETDEQRERFLRFTHELRCPKCQGQTLAGSDAGVAANLKNQLHRMIVEEKSDSEIVDYMVTRYGDFVLYKPPFQPNTYLLWFGPITIFLVGAFVFVSIVRNQNKIED